LAKNKVPYGLSHKFSGEPSQLILGEVE